MIEEAKLLARERVFDTLIGCQFANVKGQIRMQNWEMRTFVGRPDPLLLTDWSLSMRFRLRTKKDAAKLKAEILQGEGICIGLGYSETAEGSIRWGYIPQKGAGKWKFPPQKIRVKGKKKRRDRSQV